MNTDAGSGDRIGDDAGILSNDSDLNKRLVAMTPKTYSGKTLGDATLEVLKVREAIANITGHARKH